MQIQLAAVSIERLRPLFRGFPGLHGIVDAALEGAMGVVRTDDPDRPRIAHIDLDFDLLTGDSTAPEAEEVVRNLSPPFSLVVSSGAWEPLLHRVWGEALQTRTRVAFQPGDWNGARLRNLQSVPKGFSLRRIPAEDAGRFSEFADSLVYNFATLEDYAERGVGFGIEHDGRYVSGCSSFALSSHSLEFEIQTHEDFRRRGLASACAAAMIDYCLNHGLRPCWDAHNDMSAALATKLGFANPVAYTAYEVG